MAFNILTGEPVTRTPRTYQQLSTDYDIITGAPKFYSPTTASPTQQNKALTAEPSTQQYGIGNRILPGRHEEQPVGGEIEAGYGIGNRMLPDRHEQTVGVSERLEELVEDEEDRMLQVLSLKSTIG